MAIKINEGSMSAESGCSILPTARRTADRWTVITSRDARTRNQAVTALMPAERLIAVSREKARRG